MILWKQPHEISFENRDLTYYSMYETYSLFCYNPYLHLDVDAGRYMTLLLPLKQVCGLANQDGHWQ